MFKNPSCQRAFYRPAFTQAPRDCPRFNSATLAPVGNGQGLAVQRDHVHPRSLAVGDRAQSGGTHAFDSVWREASSSKCGAEFCFRLRRVLHGLTSLGGLRQSSSVFGGSRWSFLPTPIAVGLQLRSPLWRQDSTTLRFRITSPMLLAELQACTGYADLRPALLRMRLAFAAFADVVKLAAFRAECGDHFCFNTAASSVVGHGSNVPKAERFGTVLIPRSLKDWVRVRPPLQSVAMLANALRRIGRMPYVQRARGAIANQVNAWFTHGEMARV